MIAALTKKKGMVYLAAQLVGCDADTIYIRARTTPSVASAIRHQRGKVVDGAEMKLFDAIEAGEPWAIQLCLKTLGRDRGYIEQKDLNLTGGTTEVVEVVVRTREEAKAVIAAMAEAG